MMLLRNQSVLSLFAKQTMDEEIEKDGAMSIKFYDAKSNETLVRYFPKNNLTIFNVRS